MVLPRIWRQSGSTWPLNGNTKPYRGFRTTQRRLCTSDLLMTSDKHVSKQDLDQGWCTFTATGRRGLEATTSSSNTKVKLHPGFWRDTLEKIREGVPAFKEWIIQHVACLQTLQATLRWQGNIHTHQLQNLERPECEVGPTGRGWDLMNIVEVAPVGVYIRGVLNTVAHAISKMLGEGKAKIAVCRKGRLEVPPELRKELINKHHNNK